MTLNPGDRLGHYQIRSQIGAGGMGEVYRARDTSLNRDVALKVLPESVAEDPERLARFRREAELLASLNHPNIAQIYGLEKSADTPALVLELVEGPTLQELIEGRAPGSGPRQARATARSSSGGLSALGTSSDRGSGREPKAKGPKLVTIRQGLPLDDALPIARQIANALEAAHEQGIIHRDLKPANVKVTPNGVVKVLDFGLAKAIEGASEARGASERERAESPTVSQVQPAVTEMGMIMGTAAYMSPEQARGKPVDKRTDIWAFGVVLYEMLTGAAPFSGDDMTQTLARIVEREPDWHALPTTIPSSLHTLLRRCLVKQPKDRLRDIGDARLEIDEAASTLAGPDGQPDALEPRSRSSRIDARITRSRGLLVSLGLAAVAALVAVTAWTTAWLGGSAASGAADSRPFTFSFALQGEEQIAVDMDQRLFDLSDDGDVIAWIGTEAGGGRRIYYRSVRNLEVLAVPGTEGVENVWIDLSPDSRQVSFRREGEEDLWTVPLDGSGAPQRVFTGRLWSWAWGSDGSFVLAEPYGGLLRVAVPGADPEVLTRLEGNEVTHQFPQFLPDGHGVLFSVGRGHFYTTRVEVLFTDGGTVQRKVLIDDAYSASYVEPGYLVFGRGDRILAVPFDLESLSVTGPEVTLASGVQTDSEGPVTEFAVSRRGTLVYVPEQGLAAFGLAWVDDGGELRWIDAPSSPFEYPHVSPDGRSVALATRLEGDRRTQIYLLDLERLVPRRLTEGYLHTAAIWSPDGEDLLFNSTRDGHLNVYRAPANGAAEPTRVTISGFDQTPSVWCPDGRILLVERLPDDRSHILLLSSAAAGGSPEVVSPELAMETEASLSPDCEWMAFVKDGQVFVRRFGSGGGVLAAEEQVSRTGGLGPRWTRDGRRILYMGPSGRRILAVEVDTSEGLRLGRETEVFAASDDVEVAPFPSGSFDVAPDGRLLVVARPRRTDAMEVVVMLRNEYRGKAAE